MSAATRPVGLDRPALWAWAAAAALIGAVLARYGPAAAADPFGLVHDDGRHFVVWLRALADPSLFAGDPIAAYFGGLTPALFKGLVAPAGWLGVDAVSWSYLVLTPLCLGLLVYAALRLSRSLLPQGYARGFFVVVLCFVLLTLIENQRTAALPRSFAPPIVLLALAAFLERRLALLAATLFLGALLYPSAVVVAGATLLFLTMSSGAAPWSPDRGAVLALIAGGGASVAGLAPFLLSANDAGATFLLEEARALPIFGPDGRTKFFLESWTAQTLCGERGGALLLCQRYGFLGWPLALALTVGLPVAAALACRAAFGADRARGFAKILIALGLAGLCLFAAAYAVAFRAHLPARYAVFSLGPALGLSLAMLAACAMRGALHLAPARLAGAARWSVFALALAAVAHLGAAKLARPVWDAHPEISEFLRQTPKDAVVAGLPGYLDNVPAFANRSAFVALELLVPYKKTYYAQMAERLALVADVHRAAASPASVAQLRAQGVTHLILDRAGAVGEWPASFPAVADLRGDTTFLDSIGDLARCAPAADAALVVADLACLDAALTPAPATDRPRGTEQAPAPRG